MWPLPCRQRSLISQSKIFQAEKGYSDCYTKKQRSQCCAHQVKQWAPAAAEGGPQGTNCLGNAAGAATPCNRLVTSSTLCSSRTRAPMALQPPRWLRWGARLALRTLLHLLASADGGGTESKYQTVRWFRAGALPSSLPLPSLTCKCSLPLKWMRVFYLCQESPIYTYSCNASYPGILRGT